MEFVYQGFDGYNEYAYVYEPPREKLELALAKALLDIKHEQHTQDNIEKEIYLIKTESLIDDTDIVGELKEEIKYYLKQYVNF